MPRKEKFGKFVLLDEVESSGLGAEYRAAKLSASGLEKIVTVLRVRPALSASPETVKSLMDQVKFAAQLQNPNIVKLFGIGKVDSSFYISHEFIEGKSLQAVFARGKQEGFPFSVDHALLIVSKVCAALEYAHARKTEGGVRYFHGLVTPANVIVSYEGEVRTRGFGYWPARIREAGGLTDEETLALAPEQAAGGVGDTRSDLFAVGALLFQMITGESFFEGGRDVDVAKRLADAKLQNPTTDDDALPKPIREILRRSLTQDPAARFAEVQEMRKALDALLFSGDFAPTTFNLAFFMHSLFREDIDRESATLKEEREASYADYITDEVRNAPATLPPMAAPSAAALAAAGAALSASTSASPSPAPAHVTSTPAPAAAAMPVPVEAPVAHAPVPHAAAHGPEMSAREAAAGFTFHKEEKTGGKTALIGGLAAVVLIGAGAAVYVMKGRTPPPPAVVATVPPTTMSPEAVAALARVKELEEKLQAIETEKAAAAAKAEEDARKKVEAQAAARGQAVDPAVVARAQEEARKRSQAEQERKAQVERQRLEEEQRMAEAQLAEERRRTEDARRAAVAAAAAATTPPPPVTQVAVATPPPVTTKVGSLVDVNDAGVIAPVAMNKPSFSYPPIALRQRIEGKIDLTVLVDERGAVADTRVIAGAGGRSGLNEAASEYVRRWKFRPATKDGVVVKTWTNVSVVFVLPR